MVVDEMTGAEAVAEGDTALMATREEEEEVMTEVMVTATEVIALKRRVPFLLDRNGRLYACRQMSCDATVCDAPDS